MLFFAEQTATGVVVVPSRGHLVERARPPPRAQGPDRAVPNPESLRCLLKQQGDIEQLLSTYRGWSLLPKPLQILEVELLRQYQWDWLQGRVAGRLLKQDKGRAWMELWFESAQQPLVRYTGEIYNNELQRYQLESAENATVAQLIHRKTG